MPARTPLAERLIVATAVVLTAVVFHPRALDPVNVPKLTALVACAAGLAALVVTRTARTRVLRVPTSATAVAAVALLIGLAVSAAVAPHGPTAVLGAYGRNSGLLSYTGALVLLLVVLQSFDAAATRTVALAVGLAGLFTATYGALQLLGTDAVGWSNPFNPVIAAMGNPNFAAAYLGITVPVAAWGALWTGWALPGRVAAGTTALLCLTVAVLSESVQGPMAALAGLGVVALGVALDRPERQRRPALAGLGLLGAGGAALLVLGLAGTGPVAAAFSGISYQARRWYWEAALSAFAREPLTGVGLDSFGGAWRTDGPLEAFRQLGGDHFTDAAHSVPLQHLAQGGLVVGVPYLALLGVVAWALLSGLIRLRGQDRLLLAGLGGAWAAYQVQSLVSIDQIGLLTTHFVLAGAVVVAAGRSPVREVRLPGAPAPAPVTSGAPRRTGRRVPSAPPPARTATPLDVAVAVVAGAAALAASWLAAQPLRASTAAFAAQTAELAGDPATALDRYDLAIARAPGEGHYRLLRASLLNQDGRPTEALAGYRQAAAGDPDAVTGWRNTGRLAEAQGDDELAQQAYARNLELEPHNSGLLVEVAAFHLAADRPERARALLEPAAERFPDVAELWAVLGDARAAHTGAAPAREAYARALALDPAQPRATSGLAALAVHGG
jgi:putative inorganic carbon (hco3(-)) transporter